MDDLISRQAALTTYQDRVCYGIACIDCPFRFRVSQTATDCKLERFIHKLPSAQPEPLTDKEQRIFLAAIGREEKVCEEVDRNCVREPYEDSLMSVCREIKRKVKGVLWT